ncbi:MAG TPA: hypothetical protein VN832_09820 [Stellaceae bacterium]|nr:hypothetical protein [Stellaceae bacterium]
MLVRLIAALPAACALVALPVLAQEAPVPREKSPPGDIPDNQVFVTYRSPLGFSLKIPEGWARKEDPSGVSFEDKYGRIAVKISPTASAPTAASVKASDAPALVKSGHAVTIVSVKDLKLPSGSAVRIAFTSNSEPNPVTAKRIRLESERYLIARDGKLASLTLSAPAGADNADQWTLMAESFRWN